MPEFIPILITALVIMIVLLMVFGGVMVSVPSPEKLPESRVILIGSDFSITYEIGDRRLSNLNGTVSKGIISGIDKSVAFDVPDLEDVKQGFVRFKINDTNLYGKLLFYINDKEVYADYPRKGIEYSFSFDPDILNSENNVWDVKAESSGWKIWAPTIYNFNANLFVSYLGKKTHDLIFDLNETEVENFKRAKLVMFGSRSGSGKIIVKLNGIEIYKGYMDVDQEFPESILKSGENRIHISSEADSKYDIDTAEIFLYFE
ncbi:MAG: hypothetical protein ACE5J4_03610 [Candidatus Aenigmatarchaeota archaeon]